MQKIILGTRSSPLAKKQAEMAETAIKKAAPDIRIETRLIETTGDKDLASPLYALGGKGVFIKELEKALLKNEIDVAVHSLKDVTSVLAEGLKFGGFLAREAYADVAVFTSPYKALSDLPKDALIGTSSLRRKALIKQHYPHLKTKDIRGNVLSRIEKMQAGHYSALLLSEAGLLRLGLSHLPQERLDPEVFVPAPGQGVIAFEIRQNKPELEKILNTISDEKELIPTRLELAFLETIGLDCRAPLGAFAKWQEPDIRFQAFLQVNGHKKQLEKTIIGSPPSVFEKVITLAHTWKEFSY